MKKKMRQSRFVVKMAAIFLLLSGIAAFAADEKAPPEKPATAKTDDKQLVIPDKIPTDPVENAKLAKDILEKASETGMKMKGFKSKTIKEMDEGQKQETNIYQKNNPDGTTWLRMETFGIGKSGKEDIAVIFIQNNEGPFYIIGETAIKMEYMEAAKNNTMASAGQILKSQEERIYALDEKDFNGLSCYVLTTKMTVQQISEARKMAQNIKSIKTSDFENKFPVISKYYIGEKDFFIYSTEQFNQKGKKISQLTHEKVEFNIDIEDKLFQVPENMKVKIASTINDYINIMKEIKK